MTMLLVLVQTDFDLNVLIMEWDLEDYPGFHVLKNRGSPTGLEAKFPGVPTKWEPGGHMKFNLVVQERANYIAKTQG